MAEVVISKLNKHFGAYHAVKDIDLHVRDGEFLVFLGPSGCGKTTLLRMIAGLEQPTSGTIQIGERNATRLHPKDRNIAMVFQNYALYPHLTVFENIAFPLRVRRARKDEVAKKVRWAADLVDIGRLLDRKPRQMSGGERQRTALARSMVRDPEVFLLDEPLSNLDAKLRNTAREELRTFQENVRLTSIYVTHDQIEAMGLGNRIVIMNNGDIHQVGTPEEIYVWPANTFVAGFIGSPPMNLVDDGSRICGFRPEVFLPASNFSRDKSIQIDFTIERFEYLGSERLVYGLVGGSLPPTKAIARLPATIGFEAGVGQTVPFAVRQSDLRLFDRESGKSLDAGGRKQTSAQKVVSNG